MKKEISPFKFKQFAVHHDRCAMKVGTDAVLLGAWTTVTGARTVLDIGTGSGVLALMLAQRTPSKTRIDAVEIAQPDFQQATENARRSPWSEKIKVHHSSIQLYSSDTPYDLIVCNPPYFVNSLPPASLPRKQARHTDSLSHRDLLTAAKRLLSPGGTFAVILPTGEGVQFQSLAKQFELYRSRQLAFFPRIKKPQERWLTEFTFNQSTVREESLILNKGDTEWSDEYKLLTRDFYLFV